MTSFSFAPACRLFSRLFVNAVLVSGLAATAQAADRYVDRAAAPGGDGSSWATAWNSLASVPAGVQSGDTLWIRPGDYSDSSLSLASKSDVTVRVEDGATADVVLGSIAIGGLTNCTFDGLVGGAKRLKIVGAVGPAGSSVTARSQLSFQIWARGVKNCVFRGIKTTRESVYRDDTAQVHAFGFDNASDFVTVEHCDIRYTSGDGINTLVNAAQADSSATHGIYRFNTIYSVADDGVQSGYGGFTLTDNVIDNGGQPAMLGGHPDGLQVNPMGSNRAANPKGARSIIVARNTFRYFNQNCFIEYGAGDTQIVNNVFIGWRPTDEVAASLGGYSNSGIVAATITAATGHFVVANNTFYNFLVGPATSGGWSSLDSSHTKNNLFINCKVLSNHMDLDSTNYRYDTPGNVWYDSRSGTAVTIFDGTRRLGSTILIDPGVVDYGSEDLRLRADSPVRDIGVDMSGFFSTDRLRKPRPQRGGWDIGAYENQDADADVLTPPSNLRVASQP